MSIQADVVRAQVEHVRPVAEHMRAADALEVHLSANKTPFEALRDGFVRSLYSWTILLRGEPIGMFGLSSLTMLSNTGVPWLLGTDKMLNIRRQFIEESIERVEFMLTVYPHLINFVHVDNAPSIRWLQVLGFTLDEPIPVGPFQAPFHKFERFADV